MSFLTNTAGEVEREARFRRANVIEALFVAFSLLAVLWPFAFGFGILGGNASAKSEALWPLWLIFGWAFVGSPLWHRDSPESLGLGNPAWVWRRLRGSRGLDRWRLLGPMILLFGSLFVLSIANWPNTARMFKLGLEARLWPVLPGGELKVFLFSGFSSAVVVLCIVRYDNVRAAFRAVLIVSGAILLYSGAAAYLNQGFAAFRSIDPEKYPLDVLAYSFWGGMQQFFFTSYFATRLRKGFRPAGAVEPAAAVNRQTPSEILGGLAAAALLAPIVWLMMRLRYGSDQVSLVMFAGCAVFAFPAGALWAHFYRRNPRRMLVATLSGSFFGLIHIDSYGLVLVTFGLGTILSYLFMEDRFRNLVAAAFAHGLLGSTFGKFFRGDAAGPLRVGYRVGPWNVVDPSSLVLIIPLLCLAVYAALLIWAWRSSLFADERHLAHAAGPDATMGAAVPATSLSVPPSPF